MAGEIRVGRREMILSAGTALTQGVQLKKLLAGIALAGIAVEASAYTVSFQDGDSSAPYYEQTVAAGRYACPPADPIRFGCDFTGWTSDGGATVKSYDEINALAVSNDTTWTATFAEHVGRRLRVGVWSGPGSSGGLALKYHRLMWNNPRVEYVAVPPADVVAGTAFEPLDMFLIPGGTTAAMYSSMEKTGRQNLIDWVHAGGRYFGTCAGTAYCANDSSGSHIGLAPYKLTAQNAHKLVKVALTEAGQAELGSVGWNGPITNAIYYSSSPIMTNSAAANGNGLIKGQFGFKVLGTYTSGLNANHIGKYALVAGTNKLGRLFLSAPHPEYQASSYPFITKGIQWLFKDGVVKPGDTAASILAAASNIAFSLPTNRTLRVAMGPATVTSVGWDASLPLARAIDRNADYQLDSVTADNLAAGALANFDVFVVLAHHADACRPGGSSYTAYGLGDFIANGGKVLYMDEGDVSVLQGLRTCLEPKPGPEPTADWGYEIRGLGTASNEVAAVFTNASEALHWKVPYGVTNLQFLAVAGGGAGGYSNGGGGGAGGMATGTVVSVTSGDILKIQVGAGGLAPTNASDVRAIGGDSVVALGDDELVRVYGGGRGGSYSNAGPTAGGNGGGGGKGGTTGGSAKAAVLAAGCVMGVSLGHAGGSVTSERGGGGGGAGAAGGKSTSLTAAGNGGKGVVCDITGTEVCYAGGGGGGINSSSTSPKPTFGMGGEGGGGDGGLANTKTEVSPAGNGVDGLGGGGGGSCTSSSYSTGAGRGGCGVVILRYVSVEPPAPTADGEPLTFDARTFTDTSKVNSQKTIVFPEEPTIMDNVITYGSASVVMQRYYDVSAKSVAGGWQLVLALNETAEPVFSDGGEEGQKAIAVTGERVTIHVGNTYPGLWYALTDSASLGAGASWRVPTDFVQSGDLEATRTVSDAVRFYKVAVRDYQ